MIKIEIEKKPFDCDWSDYEKDNFSTNATIKVVEDSSLFNYFKAFGEAMKIEGFSNNVIDDLVDEIYDFIDKKNQKN